MSSVEWNGLGEAVWCVSGRIYESYSHARLSHVYQSFCLQNEVHGFQVLHITLQEAIRHL